MITTRLFKTLFSFTITHNYYKDGQPDPFYSSTDDFKLIPTNDCKKMMKNHGLFLKQKGIKNAICFQENKTNGVSKISRKIDRPLKLQFLLEFNNHSLKNNTDFTDNGREVFPSQKRRRIFYFNNLNTAGKVYDEGINAEGKVSVSHYEMVSTKDIVSIVPKIFPIHSDPATLSQYELEQLVPGDGYKSFLTSDIPKKQSLQKINISKQVDKLYRLSIEGQSEYLYSSDEVFRAMPFGLVEVFLTNQPNYTTETQYFIEFIKK